jgi:hypothetical protein
MATERSETTLMNEDVRQTINIPPIFLDARKKEMHEKPIGI